MIDALMLHFFSSNAHTLSLIWPARSFLVLQWMVPLKTSHPWHIQIMSQYSCTISEKNRMSTGHPTSNIQLGIVYLGYCISTCFGPHLNTCPYRGLSSTFLVTELRFLVWSSYKPKLSRLQLTRTLYFSNFLMHFALRIVQYVTCDCQKA